MLKIKITTTQNVTYNYCANYQFKIDYFIDLVCAAELCPRSAIKKITINKMKEIK